MTQHGYIFHRDASLAEALAVALQTESLDVASFSDADAFRLGCEQQRPDVVVLEMSLPDLELVKWARQNAPMLPAIGLVSGGDPHLVKEALHLGMTAMMSPPDPEALAQSVRTSLARAAGDTSSTRVVSEASFFVLTEREQEMFRRVIADNLAD
jgi:DNA-binding NtrC family response regulator